MKKIVFVLLLCSQFCIAQKRNFLYPSLPKAGKTIRDFIPNGWKIKDKAIGNLNMDPAPDVAMVLEYNDVVDEQRPDSLSNTGHPRILVVLFKRAKGYNLQTQNNTFILRAGEGGMAIDPYDKLEIDKGILNVNVEFLHENLNYKFRFQNGDMYLIGTSDSGGSPTTFFSREFNFMTKKFVYEYNDDEHKSENKTLTRAINIPKLKKLSEMLKPYCWYVFKDESI